MTVDAHLAHTLYKKLLNFYPQTFREQLGESMAQTFNDLCTEKQRTKSGWLGFVVWTFAETVIGIFREHLLLISPGAIMQTVLTNIRSSGVISLLLIVPFMIMEVVNRRNFNEDFPVFLFFIMWLNLFAVSVILLPIVRASWTAQDRTNSAPAHENTLLTNPRSAAVISIILILSLGILPLLDFLGWLSLDRLVNGPNPEVFYLPGMVINLILMSLPIAGGIVAAMPIIHTLRAGGRLFAHPLHWLIVIFLASAFAIGLGTLIIDQWPCFIGVPVCD